MDDIEVVLEETRAAVEAPAAAGGEAAEHWLTPRAPGKWSPSQVVEHVARALEESANEIAGRPTHFPRVPRLLRPGLFFKQVLKTGRFKKARTNRAMDPASGPATPDAGRARLEGALAGFEAECRARGEASATIESGIFGAVPLGDHVAFQKFHSRHHTPQLTR